MVCREIVERKSHLMGHSRKDSRERCTTITFGFGEYETLEKKKSIYYFLKKGMYVYDAYHRITPQEQVSTVQSPIS